MDAGADWLGVADLDEALALRAAGIEAPMLAWLHGADRPTSLPRSPRASTSASARSTQLERAAASADGRRRVQLKLDTGLSRNGFEPADAAAAFARAAELESAGGCACAGSSRTSRTPRRADDDAQLAALRRAARRRRAAAGLDPRAASPGRDRGRDRAPRPALRPGPHRHRPLRPARRRRHRCGRARPAARR